MIENIKLFIKKNFPKKEKLPNLGHTWDKKNKFSFTNTCSICKTKIVLVYNDDKTKLFWAESWSFKFLNNEMKFISSHPIPSCKEVIMEEALE